MKKDPSAGVYRALSPKELAEMFMNPNAPKTEAEHWAVREIDTLRAEVERLRAEKEALYASIAGIERAAAGAIYSQESIHAMALYALKPLMERGIEPAEAKP